MTDSANANVLQSHVFVGVTAVEPESRHHSHFGRPDGQYGVHRQIDHDRKVRAANL